MHSTHRRGGRQVAPGGRVVYLVVRASLGQSQSQFWSLPMGFPEHGWGGVAAPGAPASPARCCWRRGASEAGQGRVMGGVGVGVLVLEKGA
jgi:hypothetical protein